ncbi:MAG: acyl-CoA thioesterase II [Bradyrhizobium sp.]|nr:MAG: acyl-CoA thioesterase II [Bradyrhizobium sp.]
MTLTAADLVALLDVEPIGQDRFLGRSPPNAWSRIYGGQVIAQSLVAASRTVEGRDPHSLHAYFLLAGDPAEPIQLEVERLRDGRSFSTRRVVARQRDAAIFIMSVSYQIAERGLEHQVQMPDVPPPEKAVDLNAAVAVLGEGARKPMERLFDRIKPIEFRPLDLARYAPLPAGAQRKPRQSIWIRINGRLPDDPAIHTAALAYLSDMTLIDTALIAHGHAIFDGRNQVASLDHALWLHRPCRADEWLLYVQDSPSAQGARGLTRGELFTAQGVLAASVAQEGLIRPVRAAAPT